MTDPSEPRAETQAPERNISVTSQTLFASYRPLKYLRPEQKKLLKTGWSLEQGLDGTKVRCSFCKNVFGFSETTVHHRDGDETNNELPNLCPSCWEDNRKEGWIVRLRKKAEASKRERENSSVLGEGTLGDVLADSEHRPKPEEIIKNEEGEPAVRLFVIELILGFGANPTDIQIRLLKPSVVLNAASEWAGPNPKTLYPYFGRMTNPINGFITIERHKRLGKFLKFRYAEYYEKSPEEIMELNPKEGLRTRAVVKK